MTKPGDDQQHEAPAATSSAASVLDGAAASETVSESGRRYGHWATPQPTTTLATAAMARSRAPRSAPRRSRSKAADAARRRQQHEGHRVGHQVVEQRRRVGAQDEDAGDRDGARRDRGADRPPPEVPDQLLVAEAPGVPHEEHGGQVGDRRDGEHPAQHRRRVDPARPRVTRLTAGRHPTRRDPAGDRAHAVRDEDRRQRERGAEVAAVPRAHHRLAEGEPRTAQHDPDGRQGEGHEEGEHDRRVRLREPRPQEDEAEDQPHVVGFPHRPDRLVDQPPRALAARWRRRRRGPRSRRRSRPRRTARRP